jgi:hypothetical protein
MQSNPTLVVIFFSYSKYDDALDRLEESNHSNLFVISSDNKLPFDKSIEYLENIFKNSEESDLEKK